MVNSAEVIYELFERRSSIYSDRGESPMFMLFVSRHLDLRSHADPGMMQDGLGMGGVADALQFSMA